MGSHSFTCHPAEVNISQHLIPPAKLYQFADPVRMTGLVGRCFICVQFAPRALAGRWRRHSPPTTVLSFLTVPVPMLQVITGHNMSLTCNLKNQLTIKKETKKLEKTVRVDKEKFVEIFTKVTKNKMLVSERASICKALLKELGLI